MGRRKLEIKRIEDKSSRLVTFSKRRTGLINKAQQLSVLCDVEVAVIVFSAGGKLYEFCSGGTNNSVKHLVARYEAEVKGDGHGSELPVQCTKFQTCKELLQAVDRLVENNNNTEELSVAEMTQLEEELFNALMQTRSIKTQLMMEQVSALQQQEMNLIKEKQEKVQQVASSEHVIGAGVNGNGDGGGDLNDITINQIDSPQHVTLPLFTA